MEGKRNFSRVLFQSKVELLHKERCIKGQVSNLSLKGAFLSLEKTEGLDIGEPVDINISLTGSTSNLSIALEGTIKRTEPSGVGVEFTKIDMDAFSHLKHIVALNRGDYDGVLKEYEKASKKIQDKRGK